MAERPHVLYVDDEKEITDLMTLALGSEGFDVTVANDGEAAIEALSAKPQIDAIVLDYRMPMDGLQFLERFSQNPELHAIKVILCSAALPDQHELWNRLGGSMHHYRGCVQKPATAQLAKAIHGARNALEARRGLVSMKRTRRAPLSMLISDGAAACWPGR